MKHIELATICASFDIKTILAHSFSGGDMATDSCLVIYIYTSQCKYVLFWSMDDKNRTRIWV